MEDNKKASQPQTFSVWGWLFDAGFPLLIWVAQGRYGQVSEIMDIFYDTGNVSAEQK